MRYWLLWEGALNRTRKCQRNRVQFPRNSWWEISPRLALCWNFNVVDARAEKKEKIVSRKIEWRWVSWAQSFGYPLDGFATLMEFTPTLALLCSDIGEPAFYGFSLEFLVLQPHSRSRASCDRWKGFGFMSCWGTLLIIIFSTGTLPISKPCWKEW